ncbi:hypothetical protein LS684_14505 [Cytobacillus spongiae]|uniref:hypothetical protein n=1 Tax=Cytobacillus spongiae TaxID=2901381 RepID=UPI001F367465|nr:hypothetical protein [Cytobacillus spongiae]UII54861.1 hypothetical protein LS684_14505 [Cytobacillus spongiae]
MSRLWSLLLIVLGGFFVFKNRYRLLNIILGNGLIRRFFVSSFMSIPAVRNSMVKSVFSGPRQ